MSPSSLTRSIPTLWNNLHPSVQCEGNPEHSTAPTRPCSEPCGESGLPCRDHLGGFGSDGGLPTTRGGGDSGGTGQHLLGECFGGLNAPFVSAPCATRCPRAAPLSQHPAEPLEIPLISRPSCNTPEYQPTTGMAGGSRSPPNPKLDGGSVPTTLTP